MEYERDTEAQRMALLIRQWIGQKNIVFLTSAEIRNVGLSCVSTGDRAPDPVRLAAE